jgi:peroxiredoxin family protein
LYPKNVNKGEKGMRLKDPENSFFTKYFVRKPIFFVVILVLGVASFLLLSELIKVPVYYTYNGTVKIVEGKTSIEFIEYNQKENTTIYIYKNRDEYLKEISDYTVQDNKVVLQQKLDEFKDGENVKVDVWQKKISLLEMIFRSGGNSNEK